MHAHVFRSLHSVALVLCVCGNFSHNLGWKDQSCHDARLYRYREDFGAGSRADL